MLYVEDIPSDMPVPPVLHQVADFLDAYTLGLGVTTDYHAGPNDTDLTYFCVWAPSPADDVLRGRQLTATIDTSTRRPVFRRVPDFDGTYVKQKLHTRAFMTHVTQLGDKLEMLGQPRSRLNEYLRLVRTWHVQSAVHVTPDEVIAAMRLPLRLFDLHQILALAPDLIPELAQYQDMPRRYIESIFDFESLREQDVVYKTQKKHGHLPPLV